MTTGGTRASRLLHVPVEELLALDMEKVRAILTSWTRREVERTGLEGVVVGLSGGIDSALAAAVAVEALGPGRVRPVYLPHRLSSPESRRDAEAVAAHLALDLETREITAMVDGYLAGLEEEPSRTRTGNLQARARMTILYDLSARDDRLVLGTSNKSEILLGYTTLWGDNAYAVNPLGDLYKTQVRTLSGFMGLPPRVVAKPPTADLWEDQTDEGDLGFSYEEADRILFLTVDARYRPDDLLGLGFPPGLVERVLELVRRHQFKRRLPLWPKVSPRTVGLDFRYLRDWGT